MRLFWLTLCKQKLEVSSFVYYYNFLLFILTFKINPLKVFHKYINNI